MNKNALMLTLKGGRPYWCWCLLILFSVGLYAQPCRLIKDIDDRTSLTEFPFMDELTVAGDHLFFVGGKCAQSPEVYAIHSNQDSVYLPKNVWAESSSFWCGTDPIYYFDRPYYLTSIGDQVYYVISHLDYGKELWVTDGTLEGTHITKDIEQGNNSSLPEFLEPFDGKMWFTANEVDSGRELWYSDGTEDGTQMFIDLLEGPESAQPEHLIQIGNHLYFTANIPEEGYGLWRTDGSLAGTEKIIAFDTVGITETLPIGLQQAGEYLAITLRDEENSRAYLYFWDDNSFELVQIGIFNSSYNHPNRNPVEFTVVANDIYFVATSIQDGREVWKTDGTFNSATLLKDLAPGVSDSYPGQLIVYGDKLYFLASVDGQSTFMESDGTEDGTLSVDFSAYPGFPGVGTIMVQNSSIWIIDRSGEAIWAFDGDTLVELLSGFDCLDIQQVKAINDAIYFMGCSNAERGIWKWIPPTGVPEPIKGFGKGVYTSQVTAFTGMQDQIFFWAENSSSVHHIWKFEDTGLAENPVTSFSETFISSYRRLIAIRDSLLIFPNWEPDFGTEIWKTDGTSGTESIILDLAPGMASSLSQFGQTDGQYAYYTTTSNGSLQRGLYRTDGTEEGTILLKLGISSPRNFVLHNGYSYTKVFYNGETWLLKTDGTPDGTILLARIDEGQVSTSPDNVVVFEDQIYFLKENDDESRALWRTDGTIAGTEMAVPLNPMDYYNPYGLTLVGDKLFFVANDGVQGTELWVSDGTEEGTVVISDFNPAGSISGMLPGSFVALGNQLLFTFKNAATGEELWVSDGTMEGTQLFSDIASGPTSSDPHLTSGVTMDSILYFSAFTPEHGRELWQTDGTPEGTMLVQDICPGPCSSVPAQLYPFTEGRFVFEAFHPDYGLEPWIFEPSPITSVEPPIKSTEVQLTVFPNPTNQKEVWVKWNAEAAIGRIELIDLNGGVLKQWASGLSPVLQKLQLPDLPTGLFLLRAVSKDGQQVATQKLVVN